jgi:transcriptional regulator with XRE-family HTH domain
MSPRRFRRTYSPNQVVAYNVGRARGLRGWTQEQAASELSNHLEKRMSRASYSAIERSIGGGRVKQFSADELVALARGFNLPLLWFLLPPPLDDDPGLHVPHTTSRGIEFTEFLDIVFGTSENVEPYRENLCKWARDATDEGLLQKVERQLAATDNAQQEALLAETVGDVTTAQDTLRRAADLLEELSRLIQHSTSQTDTAQPEADEEQRE